MKKGIQYFVFAAIIIAALAIYASSSSRMKDTLKEDAEYPMLPVSDLFVPIHADTLESYLNTYFSKRSLKTDKQRKRFLITYNPDALILLHANGNMMAETRKILETAQIEGFTIEYSKNTVLITMSKEGDFVNCPTVIVAEILRKLNEK
jgi:hypothetical protein